MEAIESEVPGAQAMDMSYLTYDACYTVRSTIGPLTPRIRTWREVVAYISVIAPVHLLSQADFEAGPTGERWISTAHQPTAGVERVWQVTSDLIVRVFGYPALPPDLHQTRIPDIHVQNVPAGQVRLCDALFTPSRG
jgi:hypothetical protein